jgi:hypothetical protein
MSDSNIAVAVIMVVVLLGFVVHGSVSERRHKRRMKESGQTDGSSTASDGGSSFDCGSGDGGGCD